MTRTMENGGLQGLRVLVVEDEPLIAMTLEDSLADRGIAVIGPALSIEEAVRLGRESELDGAILDINIAGRKVFPVADILAERDIPFVFASGYGEAGLRDCDRGRPVLQKPYHIESLVEIARHWRQH